MHTLETAVVLPLVFFIFAGGLFLCLHTVGLIDRQITKYGEKPYMEASDCVQVLRITEVTYDLLEAIQ
ncbi:MAG: hypothetical protein IKU26_05895 [Clostridia bacterium]|nr:hypothetical protein [Clostridia bacterium]